VVVVVGSRLDWGGGGASVAQRITGLYKLVTISTVYRALMFGLGANRALSRYAEILSAKPGMKMLDVGCGPANILPYLPEVDYTGIDLNERHIAFARQRYGDKGRFVVGDAATELGQESGTFDLISVSALLHHLSDDQAANLFRSLRPLLKPDGRIVTIDNVWLPQQRGSVKLINRMDSGLNIRTPEHYARLLDGLSFELQTLTLNNLLRIPYDHFIMIASADYDHH
jgi:SAM-dependent methyltransferase